MKKNIYLSLIMCLSLTCLNGQLYPDRHTTNHDDGWRSCTPQHNPNEARGVTHWIMYDLGGARPLSDITFWNLQDPDNLDDATTRVAIDYSLNGVDWTEAVDYSGLMVSGESTYQGEQIGSFNGADVQYILISLLENNGGDCYGMAEFRAMIGEGSVPLHLVKFDLECKGQNTLLNWSVTNSLNQEEMILQRSRDGKEWTDIYSEIPETESQYDVYDYSFLDSEKNFGTMYYRLKLIDYDASFEYSYILASNCHVPTASLKAYPVPTNSITTVTFESESDENYYVNLRDMTGRLVYAENMQMYDSSVQFDLDLSQFPEGQYMLSIKQGEHIFQKKIVKITN